jgi:hypothetical protein
VLPSVFNAVVFEENSFSGLSIGAVVLGANQSVQFTGNQVGNCVAGFWLVSPSQAGVVPFDPNSVAMAGLSIAMGYPLPHGDTTPVSQVVTVPAAPGSVRIYTGSAASYTDTQREVWQKDTSDKTALTVTGGTLHSSETTATITNAVPTGSDPLYQSERWGNPFTYTFNKLLPGYYQVTLKFAEVIKTASNERIFNVSINQQPVLSQFDIFAYNVANNQKGNDVAVDWPFANILPNAQGAIVIQFTATVDNAKISAVEVDPQWNGVVPTALSSQNSEAIDFYIQLAQLAQQGFVSSAASPLSLRMDRNEMLGLSAAGVVVLGDDQAQNPKTSSLLMTGNRLSTAFEVGIFEALIPVPVYFSCCAAIGSVTRCVVSSNIILNEAVLGNNEEVRYSFLLQDGVSAPLANTVPPPEIMVSANVFQGRVVIAPDRVLPKGDIPSALSSWDFLNTVVS